MLYKILARLLAGVTQGKNGENILRLCLTYTLRYEQVNEL